MNAATSAHSLDITKGRHRGSRSSNAAFERCSEQFSTTREMVWHKLRLHPLGLTAKELAQHFDIPLHSISGRITELKHANRAGCTGDRRDGSGVVIALDPNKDLLASVMPKEGAA